MTSRTNEGGGRPPSGDAGPEDGKVKDTGEVPARDEGSVRGLCATCARRSRCEFPRPEGGVWHCEEYS